MAFKKNATSAAVADPEQVEELEGQTEEAIEGFSEEADAYEVPPPVNDGEHICSISISTKNAEIGDFEYEGKKHFYLQLSEEIVGKSDVDKGRFLFDTPNTMPRKTQKGVTTAVATLIRLFGGKATGRPYSDITTLQGILSKKKPLVKVTSQWQAQYDSDVKKAYKAEHGSSLKPFKKGQANFPEDSSGRNTPIDTDDKGVGVRTSAVVVKYEAYSV